MTEEYETEIYEGGLKVFRGVSVDAKPLEKIVVDKSSDRRTATAYFNDGHYYEVSADHSKDGGVETLENISEKWGAV